MREEFNAAYWGSLHPDVQVLGGMAPFSDERMEAAIRLAMRGYSIDADIQARGSSPWETMMLRKAYGYAWTPSLLGEPILIAPGLEVPGVAPYDPKNPPKGSLKVSVDLADYPPYNPPIPVVTSDVPARPLFEIPQGPGKFSVRPGDKSPNGTLYQGAEGKFVKVKIENPFGFWAYWEAVK